MIAYILVRDSRCQIRSVDREFSTKISTGCVENLCQLSGWQFDGVKRLRADLNEAESYHVLHRHGLLRLRSSLARYAPLLGDSCRATA